MRLMLCGAMIAGLGACSSIDLNQAHSEIENLDLIAETRRAFSDAYQDQPFEEGAIYVVAEEHGDLHTYSLTPCGGNHVCGPNGRIGHVQRLNDHIVVTGAYPGRTFYLSPGGDGYLNWRGVNRDLAWN